MTASAALPAVLDRIDNDLDQSLDLLIRALDPPRREVFVLTQQLGLTYEEAAGALGISEATVHRELKMAKAWLYRDLSGTQA